MVIPSWYQRAGYVSAMADLIVAELDKFEERDAVEVFFSAHGVPQSYVDDGELTLWCSTALQHSIVPAPCAAQTAVFFFLKWGAHFQGSHWPVHMPVGV